MLAARGIAEGNTYARNNLQKAFESKTFMLAFVKTDPIFDSLREEPRYKEILRKMNLAE